MSEFDDLVAEKISTVELGEAYHQRSNGHRSNGARISLGTLEEINQLLIKRDGEELTVNQEAVDLWLALGSDLAGQTWDNVRRLAKLGTPFAQHIWKRYVTSHYKELQESLTPPRIEVKENV